jgi:hypothetical protein
MVPPRRHFTRDSEGRMYRAQISRTNPTMILFLLDRSGSMSDPFGASPGSALGPGGPTKAQALADAINKLLYGLCCKCSKEDGIRDYFHVGVIGYGEQVGPALGGALAWRELVPISEVAAHARMEKRTKKIPDGAGGLVEVQVDFPCWIDPVAAGGTPLFDALRVARGVAGAWLDQHPNCFPPVVINITDGEWDEDKDPTGEARSLLSLSSSDGEVLLFNLHLSSQHSRPVEFPDREEELADPFARRLFHMSSPLTATMLGAARGSGFAVRDGARGFVFNAPLEVAIQFLDIGTRPSNLR